MNNKINRIHERALRIAYNDYQSTFNVLVENNWSVNIHVKKSTSYYDCNVSTKENINTPFMKETFCEHPFYYNLRNNNEFLPPKVKTLSYGTETIKYRRQHLRLTLLHHIKNTQSINEFKKKIENWKGTDCTYRLCRVFISQLGFLQ